MKFYQKAITAIIAILAVSALSLTIGHAQVLTNTWPNGEELQLSAPGDYKLDDYTGENDLGSTSAWVLKQPIRMFTDDTLSGLSATGETINTIHKPGANKLVSNIFPWGISYAQDAFSLAGNNLAEPYSVKLFHKYGDWELLEAQIPILVYPQPTIKETGPFTIYQGGRFISDDDTVIQDPWIDQDWTGNDWLNETEFENDGGTITNNGATVLGEQDQHITAAPGDYQVNYVENISNELADPLALKSSVEANEKWQVLATPDVTATPTVEADPNTSIDLTKNVAVTDANHSGGKIKFGDSEVTNKPDNTDMTVQVTVLHDQNPVSLDNLTAQKFKTPGQYTIQYSYNYTDQFGTTYAPIIAKTELKVGDSDENSSSSSNSSGSASSSDSSNSASYSSLPDSSSSTSSSNPSSSSSSSDAASNMPVVSSNNDQDTHHGGKQTEMSRANNTTSKPSASGHDKGASAEQFGAPSKATSSKSAAQSAKSTRQNSLIPQLNDTSSLSLIFGGLVLLLGTVGVTKLYRKSK